MPNELNTPRPAAAQAWPAKARAPSGMTSVLAAYLLHGLNIGLPLITLPFLTRSLGSSDFGLYGQLLSCVAFAQIVIEFGYGIHGTRQLQSCMQPGAQQPGAQQPGALRPGAVLAGVCRQQLRQALWFLPLLALALGLTIYRGNQASAAAVALTLVITGLASVSPLWFYTARREVGSLVIPTLAAKITCLLVIAFVLPQRPSLELALLAVALSHLWIVPAYWRVRAELRESVPPEPIAPGILGWLRHSAIVLQRLGSVLYSYLPVLLVAAWFGLESAGWYFLADRIVRGAVGLFTPLTSHLLPRQLQALERDGVNDAAVATGLRRDLLLVIVVALLAAGLLMVFARPLAILLGGSAFAPAGVLLFWLAPIVLMSTINALLINHLYARHAELAIAVLVWLAGGAYLAALFTAGRHSIATFTALCMAVEGVVLLGLVLLARAGAARRSG